jgi:hypothetical protein
MCCEPSTSTIWHTGVWNPHHSNPGIVTQVARNAEAVLLRNPQLRMVARYPATLRRRALRRRDGERILRERFRRVTGSDLDLDNPVTFTEKLYWRMITQHRHPDPRYTTLADKFAARDYARSVLGREVLTELYWHGTDPGQIPFHALPTEFIAKTNHGSGRVIRVSGSVDRDDVIRRLGSWLRTNYYWTGREDQYYRIKPLAMTEQLLDDGFASGPIDYRFWCFCGSPAFIQVSDHKQALHRFYDRDWNSLHIRNRDDFEVYPVARPSNLRDMVAAAELLSAPFDFVRVDLYSIAGVTKFGEMTFTPNRGLRVFRPASVDRDVGNLWRLDTSRKP